jgi:GGDEF domain-containing protein
VPPFRVRGRDVEIGVSIGVAIVDDFMTDPRSVLHAADVAMYRGKPRASF